MMMHLVPEIIINVCDRLKANDVRENERQNLVLRLETIQEYINLALGKPNRDILDMSDVRNMFRETKKARK